MNSEGADPHSGVPGPQGYRATTGGVFGVGRSEVTAGMQDMMVWNSATAAFRAAEAAANMGGLDREQTVIEQLRAGVNWLAAVDGLTAEEQELAEHLAWRVEGIAYEVESSGVTDTLWASLAELATAVDAAPFGSDQENRKPVFDALKELTNSP